MARRRERGAGSAYQDKHGQWWAKVPTGRGKTRRARAVDRKDAESKLKKLIEDRDRHRMDLSASQQSLTTWLERWLEAKKETVKPSTWEFYERHCNYMVPHIGAIKLESLEPHHVREMLAKLRKEGLSPQSCEHVRGVLRNALGMALKDHLIRENVAQVVDAVRVQPFDAPLLTDEEIDALLDCVDGRRRLVPHWRRGHGTEWVWKEGIAPDRLAPLLHLILTLGFRRGEFLKLLWADWDRKERTLRVKDAKTASGWRYLPLSDDLNDRLVALWAERQEERKLPHWKEHGVIFASEVGTKIGTRNINRWFDRIQEQAGLTRHIRIHDLRHAAISDWFAAGADPRAAQDLAGHASPITTQRIYAKSRATQRRDIIEKTQERRKRRQG
jgi:integrase